MAKKKALSILVLGILGSLVASVAFAQTTTDDLPWGGASPRFNLPTVGLESTVKRVADVLFYVLILIAFIMVVWGGVVMATAGGDPSKIDLARHLIMYALIAVAVGAISWGLVNLVASYIARLT